ncbi:MAG: TetR/AcrR family transcriptional regulator [Clostridia bacterium]|nr:TetR/AcrR family transcriptional regulator [Clostridia bacterium]
MPAKKQITRQAILDAAFELIRKNGMGTVNAREVARRMGCSTQPIYLSFANMEELKAALVQKADALYQSYVAQDIASGAYPPYKASGMAYIRFAKEEKELFKLLFMRDRTQEDPPTESPEYLALIALLRKNNGLSDDEARLFHLEMWTYVHGIAAMTATDYLELDSTLASRMLTDAYEGLRYRYGQQKEQENRKEKQDGSN